MATIAPIIQVFEAEAYRRLSRLERDQHPFALAKTVTQVTKGSRMLVRVKTEQVFKLNSKWVLNQIRYTIAKKSDVQQRGIAQAEVYTTEKSKFMTSHEEGGVRPLNASGANDKGLYYITPSTWAKRNIFTSTGKIKKRFQIGNLLKNYKSRSNRGNRKKGGKKSRARKWFIIQGKKGGGVVVRRRSNKRKPFDVAYNFVPKVEHSANWGFYKTIEEYVPRAFPTLYRRNLALAMRSSR